MGYLEKKLQAIISTLNNWKLNTGNLYVMTSNSAPSPFVASGYSTGNPSETSYWNGFDNNESTDCQYYTGTGGYWQLLFGGTIIKIQKLEVRFKSALSGRVRIYGLLENDTWSQIDTWTVSATTANYTRYPTQSEVKGIKVYWDGGSNFHALNKCQVTEWYEKG